MELIINFLNTLLPVLYFILVYLYGVHFFKDDNFAKKVMTPLLNVTIFLHLLEVVGRGWYYSHFPLASVFESFSVLALAAALIYWHLEWRLKIKTTGFFILILVAVFQFISSAFISLTSEIPEVLHSPYFSLHSGAAILGYSGFVISSIYSIMYLLLYHDIKGKRFGVIYNRLPSLESLHNLNYTSAAVGFASLTIAIILGAFWTQTAKLDKPVGLDAKIIVALLIWLTYGLELAGGKFMKWSRKKQAQLSVFGFVVILFSYTIVNLLFTSFHDFK